MKTRAMFAGIALGGLLAAGCGDVTAAAGVDSGLGLGGASGADGRPGVAPDGGAGTTGAAGDALAGPGAAGASGSGAGGAGGAAGAAGTPNGEACMFEGDCASGYCWLAQVQAGICKPCQLDGECNVVTHDRPSCVAGKCCPTTEPC